MPSDREILVELIRRNAYMGDLFDRQIEVILHPAKRKTVRCGRRAGKTKMLATKQIRAAMRNPKAISVYIALSRPTARRLLWPELKRINAEHNLGIEFNETRLEAVCPGGGQIWLAGADDKEEREKLRGHAFSNIDIDEAGSFGVYMDYLLDEVIEPALEDYDGELCLAGTPPAVCAGKFHDADTGIEPGWTRFHWTVIDNPKFPRWIKETPEQWRTDLLARKQWAEDHPTYLREWLGRWIRDASSLVYKYDPDRNSYIELPEMPWEYVMGVDLGYDDSSAITVAAFSRDESPTLYYVEQWKRSQQIISDIAAQIESYRRQYKILRTVVDTGGLGKMIVKEMTKRYDLPLRPAEKTNKFDFIEHMNSDFVAGHIKAPAGSELASEWTLLQYDEDSDKRKEDPRYDNHLADAALYAWRESLHFRHVTKEELPEPGSPAYYRREVDEYWQRRVQEQSKPRTELGKMR